MLDTIQTLRPKLLVSTENTSQRNSRILEELEKAAKEGKGAAQLDGRMIDAASAKMAENIVNTDIAIKEKSKV